MRKNLPYETMAYDTGCVDIDLIRFMHHDSPLFHSGLVSVSHQLNGTNDLRVSLHCYPFSGAFDYDFGALDDLDNPLTKSYTDIVYSTFGAPSHGQLLFMNLCRYLPARFIRYMLETGSDPALQKARGNRELAHRVARELVQQKRQEMVVGQSEKDILSLLGE